VPAVRALWALRKVYPKGGMVSRVNPDRAVGPAPEEAVLFYLSHRRFTPAELAEVVSAGEASPAGLTRFVFEERVLNVRYPLGLIQNGEPATRNAELREFVRHSWQGGHARYYAEPVILFE
jgi:L-serine kinase (ATP) / ParB family transcriptional regulator, heme-responsive regulator